MSFRSLGWGSNVADTLPNTPAAVTWCKYSVREWGTGKRLATLVASETTDGEAWAKVQRWKQAHPDGYDMTLDLEDWAAQKSSPWRGRGYVQVR